MICEQILYDNPILFNANLIINRRKTYQSNVPVMNDYFDNIPDYMKTLHLLAAEGMFTLHNGGKGTEWGWLLTPEFAALFPPKSRVSRVRAPKGYTPPLQPAAPVNFSAGLLKLLEFMAPDICKRVEDSAKCCDWLDDPNANRRESKRKERRTSLGALGIMKWTEYTLSDSEKATMVIAT